MPLAPIGAAVVAAPGFRVLGEEVRISQPVLSPDASRAIVFASRRGTFGAHTSGMTLLWDIEKDSLTRLGPAARRARPAGAAAWSRNSATVAVSLDWERNILVQRLGETAYPVVQRRGWSEMALDADGDRLFLLGQKIPLLCMSLPDGQVRDLCPPQRDMRSLVVWHDGAVEVVAFVAGPGPGYEGKQVYLASLDGGATAITSDGGYAELNVDEAGDLVALRVLDFRAGEVEELRIRPGTQAIERRARQKRVINGPRLGIRTGADVDAEEVRAKDRVLVAGSVSAALDESLISLADDEAAQIEQALVHEPPPEDECVVVGPAAVVAGVEVLGSVDVESPRASFEIEGVPFDVLSIVVEGSSLKAHVRYRHLIERIWFSLLDARFSALEIQHLARGRTARTVSIGIRFAMVHRDGERWRKVTFALYQYDEEQHPLGPE